jgi:hypothetical protein
MRWQRLTQVQQGSKYGQGLPTSELAERQARPVAGMVQPLTTCHHKEGLAVQVGVGDQRVYHIEDILWRFR